MLGGELGDLLQIRDREALPCDTFLSTLPVSFFHKKVWIFFPWVMMIVWYVGETLARDNRCSRLLLLRCLPVEMISF